MMRKQKKILLLCIVLGMSLTGYGENIVVTKPPSYELTFSLEEFSVFNSSALLGVSKYGGTAEFEVKLAKANDKVLWTVTIKNPKLLEVSQYWIAEKTAELVGVLDFDNLDVSSKVALATVKSLNAKVDFAKANPKWDSTQLTGTVIINDNHWYIENETFKYQITGNKLEDLKTMKDKSIVATGFMKVHGQFEVASFIEKQLNTLELFVMSHCPFSLKAESSIISYLEGYEGDTKPNLKVHYIFYKKTDKEKDMYICLHGEKEYKENLVQMTIRDLLPDIFQRYLIERAGSTKPWKEIAPLAGMTEEEIELVANYVEENGDDLVKNEYDYVAGVQQITDGSPAYIWESKRMANITSIPQFQSLEFKGETCRE